MGFQPLPPHGPPAAQGRDEFVGGVRVHDSHAAQVFGDVAGQLQPLVRRCIKRWQTLIAQQDRQTPKNKIATHSSRKTIAKVSLSGRPTTSMTNQNNEMPNPKRVPKPTTTTVNCCQMPVNGGGESLMDRSHITGDWFVRFSCRGPSPIGTVLSIGVGRESRTFYFPSLKAGPGRSGPACPRPAPR